MRFLIGLIMTIILLGATPIALWVNTDSFRFADCKGDRGTEFILGNHPVRVISSNLPVLTTEYVSGKEYYKDATGDVIDNRPTDGYLIVNLRSNVHMDWGSYNPVDGMLYTHQGDLSGNFYGLPRSKEVSKGWNYYNYNNIIFLKLGKEEFTCSTPKYNFLFNRFWLWGKKPPADWVSK